MNVGNINDTISKGIASLRGGITDPEEQQRIVLQEQSFCQFVKDGWEHGDPTSEFEDAWHVEAMCRHLQAVVEGDIRKLILNVPPGLAKSLLTCVFLPAWAWIKNPKLTILAITYSDDFSTKDSNRCRDLVKSSWYQQRWGHVVKIRTDRDAARKFELTGGGIRHATSTQGGATGARANLVICDDINKISDAYSEVEKKRVAAIFDNLVCGRGSDPRTTRFIVVQQRLAIDDITGHILGNDMDDEAHAGRPNRQEKELRRRLTGYTHFFLPMEYNPKWFCKTKFWTDPRKEEGESLWPTRWTEDAIAERKNELGPLGTAAQFQQAPAQLGEGALFPKEFNYFRVENDEKEQGNVLVLSTEGLLKRVPERSCLWYQVIDTALKEENTNDFTALGTFLLTPEHDLLIYDMERERVMVPKQYDWILARRMKYPKVMFQALEGRASGIGLIQEGRLKGTPFREIGPPWYQMHEVLRAQEASTRYANGMVYHRKGRAWTVKLEGEMHSYPFGKNDMATTVVYACLLAKKEQMFKMGLTGIVGTQEERSETIHDRIRDRQAAGESRARQWGLFGMGSTEAFAPEPRSSRRRMFGR